MKISVDDADITSARSGDLSSLERVLRAAQPAVFNLAMRMLGHRADAEDATQEILLRVTTHLGSWRGDSAFSTWVYSIATNQLLTARTRRAEPPRVSFDDFAHELAQGLMLAEKAGAMSDSSSIESQLDARKLAISCTQNMLLCLARDERVAYVLDVIVGLDSNDAALAQNVSPAAHRKRLSRAKSTLHAFMGAKCGLVSASADCRCETQTVAIKVLKKERQHNIDTNTHHNAAASTEATDAFEELVAVGDAVSVLRGMPAYRAQRDFIPIISQLVQATRFVRHN
jgi:RNA polymerase sigma factor (sigma-70 family)